MFTNTGNLSFYLGISFILLAFIGLIVAFRLVKNGSIEPDKLDKLIELGKWFIISVALVVGSAIVVDGFKEREQDVREIEVFDKYVTTITEVEGVEKRWLLAEYFSMVAPDGELRKSWVAYKELIKPRLDEFRLAKAEKKIIDNKEQLTEADIRKSSELDVIISSGSQSLVAPSKKLPSLPTSVAALSMNSDEWMIIAGTDASFKAAQDELKKAREINPAATIYKKENLYLTIIPNFASKSEAEAFLPNAKKSVNPDAYAVRSNNWCKNIQDSSGYFTCD